MALFVGALGFAACSDDDNTSTDPGEGGGNTKPEVSVVVTPGATTASSVSFTVAPQNADKCAYVCLKNVEGIELPTPFPSWPRAGSSKRSRRSLSR